jgi:hypothetical protein
MVTLDTALKMCYILDSSAMRLYQARVALNGLQAMFRILKPALKHWATSSFKVLGAAVPPHLHLLALGRVIASALLVDLMMTALMTMFALVVNAPPTVVVLPLPHLLAPGRDTVSAILAALTMIVRTPLSARVANVPWINRSKIWALKVVECVSDLGCGG